MMLAGERQGPTQDISQGLQTAVFVIYLFAGTIFAAHEVRLCMSPVDPVHRSIVAVWCSGGVM